jgi:hypothetical protein
MGRSAHTAVGLVGEEGRALRLIAERDRWFNEPGEGSRYRVSGDGHGESAHDSLEEAKTAAKASLRGSG